MSPKATACRAFVPDWATTLKRELLGRDQRGRFVDQGADRRDARRTDDVGAGDQRAEPVRQVDHLLTGDAWEEVLVAAGEADHLVREDRADDQRDVVLDDRAVEPDLTLSCSRPPEISAIRSAPIVPSSANVSGFHHSWLSTSY